MRKIAFLFLSVFLVACSSRGPAVGTAPQGDGGAPAVAWHDCGTSFPNGPVYPAAVADMCSDPSEAMTFVAPPYVIGGSATMTTEITYSGGASATLSAWHCSPGDNLPASDCDAEPLWSWSTTSLDGGVWEVNTPYGMTWRADLCPDGGPCSYTLPAGDVLVGQAVKTPGAPSGFQTQIHAEGGGVD